MGAFLGVIIAVVVGAVVGGGAAFGLVASQTSAPVQVEGPIVVYGTN